MGDNPAEFSQTHLNCYDDKKTPTNLPRAAPLTLEPREGAEDVGFMYSAQLLNWYPFPSEGKVLDKRPL